MATRAGLQSWYHHHVSPIGVDSPALDQLLMCILDDMTDDVLLMDATCEWAMHPSDQGVLVFASTPSGLNRLRAATSDPIWVST